MSNLHQEETLGKAYDSKLMGRLLQYAKPYWKWLTLCIFLLIIISVIDLAQPYIIKIAIDDYINVYEEPIYYYQEAPSSNKAFSFEGRYYLKEKHLSDDSNYEGFIQLIQDEGNVYLVGGNQLLKNEDYEVIDDGQRANVKINNQIYSARLLTKEEVKNFRQNDITSLRNLSLVFFLIISFGLVLNFIQVYILNYAGNTIVYQIRHQLFSHLQGMSLSFFDNNPVGRLVTRVTNDTETLYEMYTSVVVNLFKDVFLLLGIIVIMLRLNVKLALISLLVLPLILISAAIFRRYIREAYREVRVKLASINSFLNENFTGMKTIHTFKREKQQFEKFDQSNNELLKANQREILVFAIFRPFMEVLRSLGISLIIWYGGGQVLQQTIEFGVLFAFINYIKQFFQPINNLTEKYNILQSAMASSERIFALLDKETSIVDPEEPIVPKEFKGEIEFKNVWFAYNDEDWVLKDISFKINPGESIAFVGATGAGKSSIINLIGRFYDIQRGEILIDGVNIKDLPMKELRNSIGIVLQDVFMFSGTIKENILLNNRHVSDEKIREITEYVNLHSFIEKLPNQYDEVVMERGANFSTGQRQLLAFARALLFDPNVLILDEATSNIDTETETLIQDAIVKLIKGRTSIAIAHRLSTIQNCDKIIVLHRGELREMGNHQELLKMEGIYYKLYQLQYKESLSN
ncbi:ABC transporter ATP-binding protein [Alkaliphilus hydrothermalis]|uniref:ATP-binding cassette subfamily B protein/subfamily B ATP-binding cassette protein MsbA n=1 Tax=Alkaliphilus hydrothermalis TaxID=1482730 RepID=A0ABS2NPR5_9FIRM|nr:ABC transporter ATP-binding protein [Alkaliphilus hydrothermalis]MBM7614856.1 ATP-binding cassette subfamily B protein/subfamily B ATP-binding cassette protein MsbA [Alkaliphilus hydrothermalis]